MNFFEKLKNLKENFKVISNFDNEGNFVDNEISWYEKLVTFYESEKQDIIRKAIRNKTMITFLYSGDYTNSTGTRVVEPYVLGVSEGGNKVIRAYQVQGSTDNPDEVPGWRLFLTKNISNVSLSKTNFSGNRPGYNKKGDKGMIRIDLHSGKTRKGKKQQ